MKRVEMILFVIAMLLLPGSVLADEPNWQADYYKLMLERLDMEYQYHQARMEILRYKYVEAQQKTTAAEAANKSEKQESKSTEARFPIH